MKIQCGCGTKYAFELKPEMLREPVRFVCQKCGADSSAVVNALIREHLLGTTAPPPPTTTTAAPEPPPAPAAAQPAAPVRVAVRTVAAAAVAAPPDPGVPAPQLCARHIGEVTTHQCLVCKKPICPQCMELFGYVCSPHCKGKAELQGIVIPVYAHQKSVVEGRRWRKVGWAGTAIALGLVAFVGVWTWYSWIGSVPKARFAVRFPEAGYSGQCRLVGPQQLVFLHGGRLARHDLKTKQEVWSHWLIDKPRIAEQAAVDLKQMEIDRDKAIERGADPWRLPTLAEFTLQMQRAAAAALTLHVRGEDVWVSYPDKLVRHDWQSGKAMKEVPFGEQRPELVRKADEFLLIAQTEDGARVVEHVDLVSGETRREEIALGPRPAPEAVASAGVPAAGRVAANQRGASFRTAAAKGGEAPLDPQAVATRVQNMPLPARLALPATLSAGANQRRALAEMRDVDPRPAASGKQAPEEFDRTRVLRTADGFVQLTVRLLESKMVAHEAMKPAPAKSALDGTVNASATAAIANEILNEIQRDRGADVILEDQSRYQVTVRRAGGAGEWTGEVVGSPALFPLATVDVVAAGKGVVVIDKSNQKLWEAKLNYPVGGDGGDFEETPQYGHGPCVERGDTLYIFDEGTLTAFERANGNVRWRLPSVGVAGLHFDDAGMIYVNTTTASPERLKYVNQIDVTEKTRQAILKVDAGTGKLLWSVDGDGMVSYLSGKFIYTVESYESYDEDDGLFDVKTGLEMPSHVRIKRLNPRNGRVMWEHYQKRAPLDVQFDRNTIQLLFKKEVQYLTYLTF